MLASAVEPVRETTRTSPESTRNVSRLGDAQDKSRRDEGSVVVLERLERANQTEQEQLQGEPPAGPNPVEDHIGRDLEQDDTQRQHLLPNVELVLGDADFLHEVVRDGVANVSAIEF